MNYQGMFIPESLELLLGQEQQFVVQEKRKIRSIPCFHKENWIKTRQGSCTYGMSVCATFHPAMTKVRAYAHRAGNIYCLDLCRKKIT